jgi:hypothetical protein
MKRSVTAVILSISLALAGCAGMSDTQQRSLSGGAIGAGAGAVVGAIAGNTALGAAVGAAGGYLYDRYEKTKEAEYQKGYKAGQQTQPKSQ